MKKAILISVLVLSFVLAGCSSQQDISNSPPASSRLQKENTVVISDFSFRPQTITVKSGETVTWINEDSAQHTVEADSFSSANIKKGDSFEFKFDSKGAYDYVCGIHPEMKGKVIVE